MGGVGGMVAVRSINDAGLDRMNERLSTQYAVGKR